MIIYKITSPTGKIYIGQTKDFIKRMKRYKWNACKQQPKLYNSFKKYQFENHKIEIINQYNNIKQFEIDIIEKFYIKLYDCVENGLNVTIGGRGFINIRFTKEIKEKISNSKKGKLKSIETKIKMSNYAKNRSIEHTAKLIEAIRKPVLQYDLEGNFIKEWNSLLSATNNNYGDIRSCINGRQKTAGGFIWKYKKR